MDENELTIIGKTDFRNSLQKFGIKVKDRAKHMYVIGKTGTGKSTFLENMIAQDIQNGNGVAFIDPHGGSAKKLLDYVPEWRKKDVIYFDPSDVEFPIAFNPLEDLGPEKRHLVADGLMTVFEKIWPEAFSGRMTYILNNTMLALLEYPDSSMLGINRMLTDKDFRKKVVANVTDPAVKNAWDELMKWDDKRWSEAIGALINKVGQLTTNPIIRNVIGQSKSTFDFRKAMDEKKIILINLSKGMIGEQNAPLIGAMLITKIYLAAMSRAEMSAEVIKQAAPFYFYVDEFQNFANDSFASILSEARKYKLALTVANQYIAQMEETVRDAVFGNMGTTVAFRVGPLDAEFMEKVFAPVFTQEDLQNVQFGQYYVTLQIDGMGSKPFSAMGMGPIPPMSVSISDEIIRESRAQFGRPRAEVEATINEWFGFNKAAPSADGKPKPLTDSYQEKRPVRLDVGNRPNPSGTSPSAYQDRNQNQSPQRKFDPKQFDERPKKPLPPISSATNNYPKPAPKPQISSNLATLLEKLDTVPQTSQTISKPFVSEIKKEEIISAPTAPISTPKVIESKPIEPAVFIPKAVQNTDTKTLTRAATPEKKSALAEALARAMADKKPTEEKPLDIPKVDTVASVSVAEVPVYKPEQVQQPIAKPEPVIETQQIPVVPQPVAAPVEVPQFKTTEPKPSYSSQTLREVPEDILRKVLE